MPATTFLATKLRSLSFGNSPWTGKPSTLYLGLLKSQPDAAGTYSELVGAGYSRRAMAPTDWHVYNATVINKAITNWPAPASADWTQATHVGIFTAASGGTLLAWASLAQALTVTNLGTFSFAAGMFSLTIGGGCGELRAHRLLRHVFQNAAWTFYSSPGAAANTLYVGIGTNSDSVALYGEPMPGVGATATSYQRGTIPNTTAKWPGDAADSAKCSNGVSVTDFVAATADWGPCSNVALLNGPIFFGVTGATYVETTAGVIVVTKSSHGLSIAHPGYASQSGTYARSGTTVTITFDNPHGFTAGMRAYCDFSAGTGGTATDGCWLITAVTATTITVTESASGTITDGTVTVQRPQHVDMWFTGAGSVATSRRYYLANLGDASNGVGVAGASTTSKFTLVADSGDTLPGSDLGATACGFSAADVWVQGALTAPINVTTPAVPTVPANQLVFSVATA